MIGEKHFKIKSNKLIAKDIYQLDLVGDASDIERSGQFVNVKIDGFYLRRPISVCDYSEDSLCLIYKTFGKGTAKLSGYQAGDDLAMIIPLGNGFDNDLSGDKPLLIGGGVGIPPLYHLAKTLLSEEKKTQVILGFNSKADIFYQKEFEDLGCEVYVTTVDGSLGSKGFVTDVMSDLDYSYIYTCGPMPMLKAIHKVAKSSGQFSLETRMACGFGACMACSQKVKNGAKRICKEGPVFVKEELNW